MESSEEIIEKRKQKIKESLKKNPSLIAYVGLALVVLLSVWIRTRNLPGLRDVTTGGWALGPDLDPWLFLRWAKYIVENGSLYVVDTLRYVPLGLETNREYLLHPYMIAWFHNVASIFGADSVTHSAVLYPVFFFAITVVAFFFMTRRIFLKSLGADKANWIALIASFFLGVLPSLLPRTIAGIPEKESAAFFFLFATFYFFISAWESEHKYGKYIWAVLAGLATLGMASIWGGFGYIFLIISLTAMIAFFLGQVNKNEIVVFAIWLFSALILMIVSSERYTIGGVIFSLNFIASFGVLSVLILDAVFFKTSLRKFVKTKSLKFIPEKLFSFISAAILGIVAISVLKGPSYIFGLFVQIYDNLVKPATSRLIQTVAENRQPYFAEWSRSYGPVVWNIPIFFWIFMIGSILLFYFAVKGLGKKEGRYLTGGFVVFLFAVIFSRYGSNSALNGENFLSLTLYFGGMLIFLGIAGYYYFKYYKSGQFDKFGKIDFGFVFILTFFFFSLLSARGAVRLIMVLDGPAAIMASFLTVFIISKALKERNKKDGKSKAWIAVAIILGILVLFAGYSFYKSNVASATVFVPSTYNQQWQKAMSWVRENTSEDAVFAHWWDYGYWVQSIGERATVLDGGNAISYWNHFMGRYGLTAPSEEIEETAEFLYTHEVTHFLIDSTDIGKYTAFSSIGSDAEYDRRSWMSTFLKDNAQTFETKDSINYVYSGGFALDEDIIYTNEEGQRIFLPGLNDADNSQSLGLAGLGAIITEINDEGGMLQPKGIYVHQGNQYQIPLRYAFFENELIDFGDGINAGIFIFPRVDQTQTGIQIDASGAILYLSARVVDSNLARFYLYGEEGLFEEAHVEPDAIVSSLNVQGANVGEFVYFGGFRGPIKIWEINYPTGIEKNEEYLETVYPEEIRIAR